MNNFSKIIYNIGIRVGDTSTAFGGIIGGYVNQRYKRIWRKFNWPTIVPNYGFTTVPGQSDYPLPLNFKNEIYVYDSTNLKDIKRYDLQELERINAQNLNQQGNVCGYTIFESLNNNIPPAPQKTLRLYQNPTSVIVLQIPYIQQPTDLVNGTDLPIWHCDDAVEKGATADAWRTKRQFQKAADFESQYEQLITEMIWEVENDPNRIVQFRPNTYSPHLLY